MTAQPWDRVRDPAPIPSPLNAAVLLDMDDDDFELLMRTHLVPRDQTGPGRRQWAVLWTLLGTDPDLNTTTTEFLQDLLDYTEQHLHAGTLDELGSKRARRFAGKLRAGIERLNADARDRPWRWSPELAAHHPPQSRALIDSYLTRIAYHRVQTLRSGTAPTRADLRLWDALIDAGGVPQVAGRGE